jgi:lactate dehydrogenase-like 2-hydroxyacid dehydrogenase
MQKGQKTEDKTCTNLGPGRLGTQMETHNNPFHLQLVYYMQWQNEVEQQFSGEGA